MALRRDLPHRLLDLVRLSNRCLKNCRISSSPVIGAATLADSNEAGISPPDPVDKRNFLFGPAFRDNQLGTLKTVGVDRERSRLDPTRLTPNDVRKMLYTAELEAVKGKLRDVGKTWIPHSEYIKICGQGISDPNRVHRLAKSLDESGTVIIVGNLVVLRPEKFAKAVEDLILLAGDDPRRMELEEMEKVKGEMDSKAESLVRRELRFGLGFLTLQTLVCLRLTFWELSWDVMEPICFFLTSIYCMGCYGFFLVTSREPSFVNFFQSRLSSKQTRLIKCRNFDIARYNHLRQLYHHN